MATAQRVPVRRVATVGLLAVGLLGSIIGPALPGIRESFDIALSQAGLVVVAASAGYILCGLPGGLLIDRWAPRLLLGLAALALVGGALGLALAPTFPALLLAAALYGGGTGLLDGPGNALINTHSGPRRTADLNVAHGFFGVGSIVGPLAAGVILTLGLGWRWLSGMGLIVALVMLLLVWRLRLPRPTQPPTPVASSWSVLRQPLVGLLSLILCLYVGVELMVGTWAFTYIRTRFEADDALAGLATSFYWAGLTLGRLAAGTVGASIGPHALIVANTLGAAASLVLIVLAPTAPLAIVGLALMGLSVANIFPAVVAVGGSAFPQAGGVVVGVLITAGGLGGALFPWLTGALAERVGIEAALASGLLLLLALFLAELGAMRLSTGLLSATEVGHRARGVLATVGTSSLAWGRRVRPGSRGKDNRT